MSYAVKITDTQTGETVTSTQRGEWSDDLIFHWTEGNFGCDCNRQMEFQRAKGVPSPKFGDCNCAATTQRYKVVLPNGQES